MGGGRHDGSMMRRPVGPVTGGGTLRETRLALGQSRGLVTSQTTTHLTPPHHHELTPIHTQPNDQPGCSTFLAEYTDTTHKLGFTTSQLVHVAWIEQGHWPRPVENTMSYQSHDHDTPNNTIRPH
jgi:hypothetical protein